MRPRRRGAKGWLVLLGGGEFSFGETLEADGAWLGKTEPGSIGFVPAASGSGDYGRHFVAYLKETFQRQGEVVPIYRRRDARRAKNCRLLSEAAAVYLGGGVVDHVLETLAESPVVAALGKRLGILGEDERAGSEGAGGDAGVIVAMAAAAQATGSCCRSLLGRQVMPGLGWLSQGVVEPNFDPAHDRRLRSLVGSPGVTWGLGLPAGSAVLLGPQETVEYVGPCFGLSEENGELGWLES